MAQTIQPSFARGELTPRLHARIDLALYQTGYEQGENVYVAKEGGIANRPGTYHVVEVKDSTRKVRVIEFEFSDEQAYALEFGHQCIRIVRYGGQVLTPSVAVLDGLDNGSGAVRITTATDHEMFTGETVTISGITDPTYMNGDWIITKIDATKFDLVGSAHSTDWVAGGMAYAIAEVQTTYTEDQLFELNYTQDADVMTIVHPDHPPRELTRTDHHIWTLTDKTFAPSIAAPTNEAAVGTGGSGSTEYKYKITAESDKPEEGLPSGEASVTSRPAALSATEYNTVSWDAVTGAVRYNVYKYRNGLFGYIGSSEELDFIDDGINADVGDTPPAARNPFSGAGEYPGAAVYWEQRLIFGGSDDLPDTSYTSKTGAFSNFSTSLPAKADDAITFGISSRSVNRIRHYVPFGSLLILTSGVPFRLERGDNGFTPDLAGGIFPAGGSPCGLVRPLIIGPVCLFTSTRPEEIASGPQYIQRGEPYATVQEMVYDDLSRNFVTNERSVVSSHLVEKQEITDWAYAQFPNSLVWAVRDDGLALTLTHMREHEVYGWAKHRTGGFFESVCSIPEGAESGVYFVVRRRIDGTEKRFIERLASRRYDDIRDAHFVDCGLSYDVPVTVTAVSLGTETTLTAAGHGCVEGDSIDLAEFTGTTEFNGNRYRVIAVDGDDLSLSTRYLVFGDLGDDPEDVLDSSSYGAWTGGGVLRKVVSSISGADHLAGATVSLLIDGNDAGTMVWAAGSNTLPSAGSRIHVGLPYTAFMKTLSIAAQPMEYDRKKAVQSVTLWLNESRGIEVAPTLDGPWDRLKPRELEDWNEPTTPKTGLNEALIEGQYQKQGSFVVRQVTPLPVEVNSVLPKFRIGA